jgi:hypothetical protein
VVVIDTYDPGRALPPVKPGDTFAVEGRASLILRRTV